MENVLFSRKAALCILPMIVASCGGSSEQGLIKNSPNIALSGCTTVAADDCNPTVESGVIVKQGADKSLRFFTLTDNGNGTYTYSDGEDEVVITQADLDILRATGVEPDGVDFEVLAWAGGTHTDASVIPVGGTALYEGGAGYHTDSHLHDDGTSSLSVDFGAGTADLTATFAGGPVIDRIEASNMVIDGYSFTGDEVVLYRGDNLVDLTGANSEAASAGMFFGPINVLNVPDAFGAVAVRQGDDDAIWLHSSGGATGSAAIVPAD